MDPHLPWFILLNPLVASALIHLLARKSASASQVISVFSACFGLIAAIGIWSSSSLITRLEVAWIDFGPALRVPFGLLIDDLSRLMLLVVAGIGALVHIYSTVYMERDDARPRYFGNLSLFMFSMLGIVLADNFVMMFIFWELVGLSSYLLIGHWFRREAAAAAANKAFLTNRIGDFGFMLGILMVWAWAGTVVFPEISGKLPALNLHAGYLTAAALLIFCGAVGKSAQVPLHVWLPDAMEGPTPVSALIHAATMVAAGVYMLARVSFLIELAPAAQTIIALIGVVTAFLAALIGTQQDDIKRILAYSTLSQLGYMILAIGVVAPGAAMFHLWTHAFFKALLFLGAGAIIHALHHEQDIWKMGGLSKKMRLTFGTFAIGTLALTGCPLLSGFYSKDAILLAVYQSKAGVILFPIALLTAFLTAFYMTRLVVVVFFGKARSDAAAHGHDGPIRMSGPLAILALLSVIAGWHLFAGGALGHYQVSLDQLHQGAGRTLVPFLATIAFLGGTVAGWLLYAGQAREPVVFTPLRNKLYFDEVYTALIAGTQGLLASIAAFIDKWVIDGLLVRGLSGATWGAGFVMRLAQFGNLQGYALLFAAGVIALIYYMVFA